MYVHRKKSCKGDIEQMINSHFSIEGGRWCESKRIRMEGHKAKAKLRATEVKKCKLYVHNIHYKRPNDLQMRCVIMNHV